MPVVAEQAKAVEATSALISLDFDNTALATVFSRLEKLHKVEIVYDDNALKDCRLSASLTDEPLFVKLRLICKTLGGSYQIVNNQIVVQAPGCR